MVPVVDVRRGQCLLYFDRSDVESLTSIGQSFEQPGAILLGIPIRKIRNIRTTTRPDMFLRILRIVRLRSFC